MSAENETIADITADMRKRCFPYAKSEYSDARYVAYLGYQDFPDRIEAAWKREKSEYEAYATSKMLDGAIIIDNRGCGNAAAMREAIEKAIAMIFHTVATGGTKFKPVIDVLESALAAPPRNCDVGTEEEQTDRYDEYCNRYFKENDNGGTCEDCPLASRANWSCQLKWAQMPYEKGGAK